MLMAFITVGVGLISGRVSPGGHIHRALRPLRRSGRLLPATVFAQNMGGQVPLVAREMRDRDDLNKALCAGLAGSFVLYSILAVSVAYSFGSIAKAANCQWDAFGVGIQYSVLLDGIRWLWSFPRSTCFRFILKCLHRCNTMTLFRGAQHRAQRQVGYRRAMRACVALPPIIGAGCMAPRRP